MLSRQTPSNNHSRLCLLRHDTLLTRWTFDYEYYGKGHLHQLILKVKYI